MSNAVLISTRKGLFTATRSTGWKPELAGFLGENVTLAMCDPRDDGWYAALNLGHFGVKLKYSPDQGKTWEDRAAPAYGSDDKILTGDGKPATPATLKLIWALTPGSERQPGRIWAGTLPGGLFRSDDGGKSWELNRSLWDMPERGQWFGGGADFPGIHAVILDPRSDRTVRIAISSGGVWLTEDDGEHWRVTADGLHADYMPPERRHDPLIQDVHMLTQCRQHPDCLWIQHHNGIFRSVDGGKKWEHVSEAKPSGFGFGVVVDPRDGSKAWFVPAVKDECRLPKDGRFVVSHTRDGGKSFDLLSNGLPQPPAYDLVLRHAIAIDDTGDRLAIGSTTGGCWISENQGDLWQEVSSHLPPIHAVTWV